MDRHDVDRTALPGVRERTRLRERMRLLLATHWPPPEDPHRAAPPALVATLWQALAAEGIAALGADRARGGLREAVIAMHELGRAACTVPLLGHLLGNLVLARDGDAPLVDLRVRQRLHGGALRMTIAFVLQQGSEGFSLRAGRVTGLFRGVDAALQATHLLLATADGLAVADLGGPGVSVVAADGTADASCADVRLESASVDVFPLPAATLADLRLLGAVLALARRQGEAEREPAAAPDAPRPDLLSRERVRSAIDRAAESFDFARPHWREQAAGAVALGAAACDTAWWRTPPVGRESALRTAR